MIKPGSDIFLQDPRVSDQRKLLPGTVQESADGAVTIELSKAVAIEVESEVLAYYELRREFVQQPARVESVEEEEEAQRAVLSLLGDPISAEGRQHYRTSTLTANVSAALDDEPGCPVLDVSMTGFAVLAKSELAIGQTLPVSVQFGDDEYVGRACIQSVCQRGAKYRYGLRFIEDGSGGDLKEGLGEISLEVQRMQLRRQSGAGA